MGNYNNGETERNIAALSKRQNRLGDLGANVEVTADMVKEKDKEILDIIKNIQLQGIKLDTAYNTSLQDDIAALVATLRAVSSMESPNEAYQVLLDLQSSAEALLAKVEQKRQLASSDAGITNAAGSLHDGAMKLLGGDDSDKRKADLDLLKQQLDQAALVANEDERREQVAFLEATMRKLFNEIAAEKIGPKIVVTKTNKDDPEVQRNLQAQDANRKTVEQAYEKALKARFGITITIPENFQNTHLDRLYEMFDKVPIGHVVHSQLKGCEFTTQNPGMKAGLFHTPTASIKMGNFGREKATNTFEPGDFSSVALHEIGHSVDSRFNIVAKCQNDPACGGWEAVDTEDLVAKCIAMPKLSWVGKRKTPNSKRTSGPAWPVATSRKT